MDIESDDSERWEDFFGSSTDLTPSLLGIYDTLTGSLVKTAQAKQKSLPDLTDDNNEETSNQHLNIKEDLISSKLSNSTDESNELNQTDDPPTSKFERNTNFTRSNICFLSHNVQRLLHHYHSTEKIDKETIKQQKSSPEQKQGHKYIKKTQFKHSVKPSIIPLSKTATKITRSSDNIVKTFSSSTECINEIDARKYPQTPNPLFDSDKTPTNSTNEAFNFEIGKAKKSNAVSPPSLLDTDEDIIEVDKVMELGALYDRDTKPHMTDVIEAYNYSVEVSFSEVSTIADSTENSISSIGTKSTEGSPTINRKQSPQSSPLLTYSRRSANKTSTPISSPLNKSNEQTKTSIESLTDRLSVMKSKFSPKESRKPKLMPPEIASLKHRPLSSSSISSTSSSSSSGSEHIKLPPSYLASEESLADHSENEIDNRHGTYSVFERTCMELVDTEKNYVEDLRQVITGYLQEWRDQQCFPPEQLAVLFSNIEEIYEFNGTLLRQLINSGLNPAKIANCFIDLREKFDVYTTYCTRYPEAISLLTSLLQEPHSSALLNSTQRKLQHKLPLGSHLLKPVQRILKYHLLLEKIMKNCDVEDVAQAREIMKDVAANINQVQRKLDQKSRVKQLSGILDGWMGPQLTVLGDLRQEGLLMENSKPRSVFLFGTMLIITKPKEDGRLQFKRLIQQNNLMLNEHLPGEPTSFYVIPYDDPRSQIKLTAKNREQKRVWAQDIKSVMLEKFNNIPVRARELVYKLGDEEERAPDTNKWKWLLNNSKPIYLERRNECRRSEIRNRSKIKRKTTVTSSTSFEGFSDKQNGLEHRVLLKNLSMDDNMVATLPRTSASTVEECCSNSPDCECPSQKSSIINPALSKGIKERSKSVPRMSVLTPEIDDNQSSIKENLDSRKSKSTKSVEVKMYNTKTIPKRIATLKKNRSKKETSTFYMDLNDSFEETVLRITESTENLSQIEVDAKVTPKNEDEEEVENENEVEGSTEESIAKEDAKIISDLLKNKKDFERIYNKPQKKKSLENGSNLNSPDPDPEPLAFPVELPPRPPSKSPPPLEVEQPVEPSEPIYETLLRNVHVPYKFSPILNRSKSQQYYKPREKKSTSSNRPESDYVTLVYSASGNLQKIGDDLVSGFSSGPQLRSSDTKINYETLPTKTANSSPSAPTSPVISNVNVSQVEAIYSRPATKNNLVKRLLSSSKAENVSGSENSLIPRVRKSVESSFGIFSKPPERRVSDVTDMCRQSYLHRQGSEAVGERIANVDYADPKTLFTNMSVNNSAASLHLKGDSVFSLTSSSDSVFDFCKKRRDQPINLDYLDDNLATTNLEKDFRDSAIYSDDNEKRHDYGENHINGHSDSPPPLPPPRKTIGISNPAVIVGPAHMSSSASRSWVMKQIENFSRENHK